MTAWDLQSHISATGQERSLRKLCISSGLAKADKVAIMSLLDVCEAIAGAYELVGVCDDGDRILLVSKADEDRLWQLLKPIDR